MEKGDKNLQDPLVINKKHPMEPQVFEHRVAHGAKVIEHSVAGTRALGGCE
jgi:hypothetical protein